MADKNHQNELLALTANIVMSHVSNNPVPADNLTKVIREVYETYRRLRRHRQKYQTILVN